MNGQAVARQVDELLARFLESTSETESSVLLDRRGRTPCGGAARRAGGDVAGQAVGVAVLLGGVHAARRVAIDRRGTESGSDSARHYGSVCGLTSSDRRSILAPT